LASFPPPLTLACSQPAVLDRHREEKGGQVKLDALFITLFLFVVLVFPPS
jgi:hypothetical protein